MQSNNNSTDQQLLDRGWAEMSDRLHYELRHRSKWEAPLYLITSLTLLAAAALSLTHQHDLPAELAGQLEQTETITQGKSQDDKSNRLEITDAATTDLNQNQVSSQVADQEVAVKEKAEGKVSDETSPTASLIRNNSRAIQTQTAQHFPTRETEPQPEIKIRNNYSGIDLVIAAQLSIPVKATNLSGTKDLGKAPIQNQNVIPSLVRPHQVINALNNLPIQQSWGILYNNESPPVLNKVNLPKQRKFIPQLNAGYAYSLLSKSGYNIGFGLDHQLNKVKRLDLFYGLSFSHFRDIASWGAFYQRGDELGVGIFEGGAGNVNETEQEMLSDYNSSVKASVTGTNQLGLSIAANCRISPRFSIGAGTTLMYQKLSTQLLDGDPSMLTDESRKLYDKLAEEVVDNSRITFDLSGQYHLTPRLSLRPYWKIQPSKSLLRVNQVGVDLSFRLK